MILYYRLLRESFVMAINSLTANKLRTFLSLLGVTIGIFSIIAVLAAVDSLDRKVQGELSDFDNNTMYVFKYPFGPTDVPTWKREQFPDVTFEEFSYLRDNVDGIDKMSFNLFVASENIKFEDRQVNSANVVTCSEEYESIDGVKIEYGRFFNAAEAHAGSQVVVIGNQIAEALFDVPEYAIGKHVRIYGKRFTVIGVIKKQGNSMFGGNKDVNVFIPVNFARNHIGEKNATPAIIIKPEKGVDMEVFKGDVTYRMRLLRGLKPSDIDNFFLNVFSGFTDMLNQTFGIMNLVGWVIAGFSLLVGGFGIANIMFVSVKERTNLIGIQKSLGAKNKFILFQFLFEAVILSVIGGVIGLFLVWIISLIATYLLDFEFILGFGNILLGTVVSAAIGLLSGLLPALNASRLDPVEAIRTGM